MIMKGKTSQNYSAYLLVILTYSSSVSKRSNLLQGFESIQLFCFAFKKRETLQRDGEIGNRKRHCREC
jgi:hypothetical protein